MQNKGFTLVETLVSILIFGILSILMFQMTSRFFQLFTISSSKQSVNSSFIKAYKEMQKDLSITDSRYVYSYKIYLKNIKTRWILFPVPTNKNGLISGEGNKFNWQRIYFYYLNCTNSNCNECKNKNYSVSKEKYLENEKYKFCSDKNLIRLIYDYTAYNDSVFFPMALSEIGKNISSYTLSIDSNSFPSEFEYEIKGYNKIPIIRFVEKKIIAKDIFDMDITTNSSNVNVKILTVRKDDIKKELNYGTADFTKSPASRFVEQIEFTTTSKNNN